MNSKSAGIYSITSKVNGKRYVGSAVRICKRWIAHLNELRKNNHNPILQNHYNKYGEDDLVFSILEVVERGELSLQDFKELLISKEQEYLNNWGCCEFNCCPTAGSPLGYKKEGAKYYSKKRKGFRTYYNVFGECIEFSNHITEEEAIKEVEYLKTLTDEQLLEYKQKCDSRPTNKVRYAKNYTFNKCFNKYTVYFRINNKQVVFGYFKTEQEAIDKVKQVKLELGIE